MVVADQSGETPILCRSYRGIWIYFRAAKPLENPANEIGRIVRDHDGLLLVDAVSACDASSCFSVSVRPDFVSSSAALVSASFFSSSPFSPLTLSSSLLVDAVSACDASSALLVDVLGDDVGLPLVDVLDRLVLRLQLQLQVARADPDCEVLRQAIRKLQNLKQKNFI